MNATETLSVIILAAGKGTRMKSNKPKVLQTLANKPLLAHVLDTCGTMAVNKTIVVYGFGGEQVQSAMANYDISWVEQTEQLGTGHAVKVTLDDLPEDGKSLILYGDVPLVSSETLSKLEEANDQGISMLTLTVDNPFGLGRIKRDAEGKVLAIVEQKDADEEEKLIKEINSGIYCVDNALLHKYLPNLSNDNAQQEYYLTDIVKMAVADDIDIKAIEPKYDFEIEGVNDRQQLAILERKWQAKLVNDLQVAGVQFADPSRVDIRANANGDSEITVGQDVFVDANVIFEGNCVIGNNVQIDAGSVIKHSQIGDNTHIKVNCLIDNAVVGRNAAIGPFAHLRPETVLADDTKVGNFVETKKANIGKGSKVNHLSYIGDAKIGKEVNIGAGTITCNYDGVNKSLTQIDDNAFIGSNSSLVAPVKIGKMATVGAGSVITKACPDNKLSLTRAKQATINSWKRPVKK
ncbi:bifunctional UDP-N-acetylglucosamine diphosphorylase/glucosamine-1-phosphate N-acetyltransferase GlmU [Psychrobacter sp. HD31]|uniref:bifunctional UDP-N-acetylglucosamine diphosphorylase/glucosamine-1-phosphate N-acetyltransferase GlmU n=1 Tax=Psychrobacter sp. HD31 TaxID=3112003 RepID=UPI003DA3B346